MSSPIDVNIGGIKELQQSMKQFTEKFQKSVVTGAVRAAAIDIKKEAKKNVPVDHGVLRDSIDYQKRKTRSRSLIAFVVGPRKDVIKNELRKRGVKKWYVSKSKGYRYSNHDNYGGYVEFGNSTVAPQPYLAPAYENSGDTAISHMKVYMQKRIDREIKRAAKL